MRKLSIVLSGVALLAGCGKDDKGKSEPAKGTEGKSGGGGRAPEAEVQLRKLGKNAKVAFVANAEFPKLTIPLTPSTPCCSTAGKCAADPKAWDAWQALEFQISDAHYFQYSYESTDGKKYVAKAVGDLDCDGTSITYVLEGSGDGGNVTENMIAADPSKD